MKLSYRGLDYDTTITCPATLESGITIKYRGSTYTIQQAIEVAPQPKITLTYRGVTYAATHENRGVAPSKSASWKPAIA